VPAVRINADIRGKAAVTGTIMLAQLGVLGNLEASLRK
jgi:hypothetical protein